jgi:hypothetical protein
LKAVVTNLQKRPHQKPTLCLLVAISLTTVSSSIHATGIVQSVGGISAMPVTDVMVIALGNMIGGLFAS